MKETETNYVRSYLEKAIKDLMHYGKVIYRKEFYLNGNCYTIEKIEFNNRIYRTLQTNGEITYVSKGELI